MEFSANKKSPSLRKLQAHGRLAAFGVAGCGNSTGAPRGHEWPPGGKCQTASSGAAATAPGARWLRDGELRWVYQNIHLSCLRYESMNCKVSRHLKLKTQLWLTDWRAYEVTDDIDSIVTCLQWWSFFTRDNWYPCSKEELDFAAHVQELREEAGWGIGLPCYSLLVLGQGSLVALISFVDALLFDVVWCLTVSFATQRASAIEQNGQAWANRLENCRWKLSKRLGCGPETTWMGSPCVHGPCEISSLERLKISQRCSWKSRVGRSG